MMRARTNLMIRVIRIRHGTSVKKQPWPSLIQSAIIGDQGVWPWLALVKKGRWSSSQWFHGEMRDRGEVESVARPCVVMRLSHRHHRPRMQLIDGDSGEKSFYSIHASYRLSKRISAASA
jgi:hypothetical protein